MIRASRASARIMRKLHIDELPQILNVLRGDMSLRRPASGAPAFRH